eukprot:m51a1_g746 hypothetical protein (210) ;mRNA; f:511790-512529
MRVLSPVLTSLHLDPHRALLSARNVQVLKCLFDAMDAGAHRALDDVQFVSWLRLATDLTDKHAYRLFDVFDTDKSGLIDFSEFYFLCCMLIAVKDGQASKKRFLFKHGKTCFELLDEDGSGTVSQREFEVFGYIFDYSPQSIREIFREFDVTGDHLLDYAEYRMYTFACLEMQEKMQGGAPVVSTAHPIRRLVDVAREWVLRLFTDPTM